VALFTSGNPTSEQRYPLNKIKIMAQEQKRGGGGEGGGRDSGGGRGGRDGGGRDGGRGGRDGGKGKGGKDKGGDKEITYQERVIQIRRVSKVVKGGKKLSFRAIVVIGNEKGEVGVGVGKASDVIGAVRKGVADGKKHLITIPLTKSNTIPHPIVGGGGGANVMMRPAAPGTGVIAGGAVRTVLELAGVKNILAKQLGSGNPLNNARAAVNALKTLRSFTQVAEDRGVTVADLFA
jgi:small subunit ribosomal protein S5